MQNLSRNWALCTGKFKELTSVLMYSTRNNRVYNLKSLRPNTYLSLNDVIRHRVPNFAGSDPEPLTEVWISPKDYTSEVIINHDTTLEIKYRCQIDYLAKNPNLQSTAFVVGTASIKDGNVRTREPRLLLMPIYYLARIASGFHHP